MTETPGSTICCSYCGQTFYLPKDCQEHVRAVHLAFGEVLTLSLEPDDLSSADHDGEDQPNRDRRLKPRHRRF